MRGQRTVLLILLAGAAIAFVVSEVRGHSFQVLALPGIHFAMAMRTDLRISSLLLVFVGNWIFYSAVVGLVLWVARKVQARRHG
jgi:ABC-type nickel/cobalt efflux system permease component RcnA